MSTDKTPADKVRERAEELAGPHTPSCAIIWEADACSCDRAQRAEAIAALIEENEYLRRWTA